MSKREKLLLNVLLWIVITAILGVLFFIEKERKDELESKIGLMEGQIQKFSTRAADEGQLEVQKERLIAVLEEEKRRFYKTREMDPYRFGIIIRDLLVSNNLVIKRYQTLEIGESMVLEFSVTGDGLDYTRFLESLSSAEKYWSVSFLSINARGGGGEVSSVFRVSYETID